MSISIGRLGYLGLAIEATPGSAEASPDVYLPYTDNSIQEKHEPIEDISARTSRIIDSDSKVGKKWSEGDIGINTDVVNAGYLLKLALGNEIYTAGSPDEHVFYTTVSGNTPKTATLWAGRETDNQQITFAAVDSLEISFDDGLSTMTASIMGSKPSDVAAQSPTTTSGTILSFADCSVKFGSDLSAADGSSATAINSLSLTMSNNLEVIHRSGSNDVSTIRTKGFKCEGNYELYFDSVTDRDAFMALQKRAMIIEFTGNADESLKVEIPEFRLQDAPIDAGIDDFFVITGNFVAEDKIDAGVRQIKATLENDKSSTY